MSPVEMQALEEAGSLYQSGMNQKEVLLAMRGRHPSVSKQRLLAHMSEYASRKRLEDLPTPEELKQRIQEVRSQWPPEVASRRWVGRGNRRETTAEQVSRMI